MGTEDKPFPGAEPDKLNTFRKYYSAHMGTPLDFRLEKYRAGLQDLGEMEKRFGPMYGEWAMEGDISRLPMSRLPYTKLGYTPSFWEDPYRVARYHNAFKAQSPGTKMPDWIDPKALDAAYKYMQKVNGNKPFYDWKFLNVNDPARQFLQALPMPPDELLLPDEVYYKPTPQAQRQPTAVEQYADPRQNPNWDKLPWWNKFLSQTIGSGSAFGRILSTTVLGTLGGGISGAISGAILGPGAAVAAGGGAVVGTGLGFGLGVLDVGGEALVNVAKEQGWGVAAGLENKWLKIRDLVNVLNTGWEFVKRTGGVVVQTAGSIADPERYGPLSDLLENPAAAWKAGTVTTVASQFEMLNLPQGIQDLIDGKSDSPYASPITGQTVWRLGEPEPQPLMDLQGVAPEDILTGADTIDAIVWARRQIAAGASSTEVLALMLQRYGISGQMRELMTGLILDPGVDVFPKLATGGLGILGKITGNSALAAAASKVSALRQGGGGPITTMRMYQVLLNTDTPVEVVSAGGRLTRWLGGVERTSEIQRTLQIDQATRILGDVEGITPKKLGFAETEEPVTSRYIIDRWLEGPKERAKIRDTAPEVAAKLDKIYPKGLEPGTKWAEARKSGLEPQNGLLARIFGLTPRSRAVEVLGILGDSMKVLMDQYAEPAVIVQAMKRVTALTGLNAEDISLRFIGTPEGAYLVHALKDFNATTVQELLKLWEDPGIAAKRDVLNLVAKLTNERPYDVLRRLEDVDGREPFFQALMKEVTIKAQQGDATAAQVLEAAKSGIFSKESLSDMFGLFMEKNVPFHPEQWKAMLFDAWMSHVGKWTVDRLGVRVEPLVTRLADVMKSAQSLLLLDINPNYFVNNAVNNIATMTIDGSMGMKSIRQALDWWSQFGIYPFKLRQAFGGPSELGDVHVRREKLAAEEMGFMDLAFKSESDAAKTISDAAKGKGGLRVADDWLKNIRSKVGVFSKLSRKVEEWSSVQATTKGTQQFWNAQWRAGKGYRRMPPALEQLLGSDLSKLVYGLVDGSLSMKQIEDGLVEGQYIHRSIESFADDVSKALGMDRDMVSTVMNESGATEFLRQHLPDAKTPDEVRGVFSLMRAAVQKHIDDLIVAEHVTRVGTTAAQVKVGDWLGFVDAMKDLDRQFDDWWTQHILKMNDAMGQASKVEDHGVRNQLIAARMAEADMESRRVTSMQVATIEGIEQGFRDAGVGFPENYSNIFRSQFDGWREFFTQRDSQWRDFWAKVQSKELPFGSKDFKEEYVRVTTEMDNAYGRQALETMHFMEEMDDAIVRMIADSDAELADKVGIYFAELRDHKAVQMAREQNIRRAMTQIRIKGKPTGKQVASILKSIFKGDDEWLKAIDPWLKELADQPVANAFEINNRLYKEYTENLKIPSISERENIRIQNERNIVEPTVKVPTEKVEVDKAAEEALVEGGLPRGEAERAAVEGGALVDKGPEVKTIPEVVRTEAFAADGIRAAASEAGINTATADGRPMDNWLVNWINSDEGIGLRKSGTPIRRLDELDPGEYPAVIRKLAERKLRNDALIKIAQERGMTLDALRYLEDGKASTARLRKIAVQNGMPEVIANLAPKPIMRDWLRAKRDGVPYRGPGDRLMTLKNAKDLLREMTKGNIEGEPQLNDVLTIWEQMAKSEGMSLDEWIVRRLADDDPGIAESLYQMQGVNHPYTQAAIARFGVAGDIRKAGCVLRDGSLLDVGEVGPGRQIDPLFEVGGEIEFLSKTGNIRVDFDGDSMNLVTYGLLSKEQRLAIENLVRRHNPYRVTLELRCKNRSGYGYGGTAAYFEVKDVSIGNLNKMFDQLHDTGAGTLYQIADAAKGMRDPAVKRAIDHFGLTDNIDRAGFMLADGKMLDFGDASKSKFGWIATGFERKVEHIEIGDIYTGQPSFEAVNDFLRSTNSLRVTAGPKRIMFETHKPLTMEQMIALNDITLKTGRTIFGEYRDPKTGEIKGYGADPNIESLSQMWSDFDEATNRTLYQQATAPIFYSFLSRVVDKKMQGKMPAQDALNWIQKQGVKTDELQWTGLRDFLEARSAKGGTVTKEEIQWWLDNNRVDLSQVVYPRENWVKKVEPIDPSSVREVVEMESPTHKTWYFVTNDAEAEATNRAARIELYQGNYVAFTRNGTYSLGAFPTFEMASEAIYRGAAIQRGATQYEQYRLEGGWDYQEHLLTLPEASTYEHRAAETADWMLRQAGAGDEDIETVSRNWGTPEASEVMEKYGLSPKEVSAVVRTRYGDFDTPHWQEPNVLAHTRTDMRTDDSGRKVMYADELQSDWHQKGREQGYAGGEGSLKALEEARIKAQELDAKAWEIERSNMSKFGMEAAGYSARQRRYYPAEEVIVGGSSVRRRVIPYKVVEAINDPREARYYPADERRWLMLGLNDEILAAFPSKENLQKTVDILHTLSEDDLAGRDTIYARPAQDMTRADDIIDPSTREVLGKAEAMKLEGYEIVGLREWSDEMMAAWKEFESAKEASHLAATELRLAENVFKSGVPDAPWKKDWHELTMRYLLRQAVERGADRLAWSTAKTQIERWSLGRFVDEIKWVKDLGDPNGMVTLYGIKDGEEFFVKPAPLGEVAGYVGKEMATKISESTYPSGKFEGEDLYIGKQGMQMFYDELLPRYVRKYGKQWEQEPYMGKIETGQEYTNPVYILSDISGTRGSLAFFDRAEAENWAKSYWPLANVGIGEFRDMKNVDLDYSPTDVPENVWRVYAYVGGERIHFPKLSKLSVEEASALVDGFRQSVRPKYESAWMIDITPEMRNSVLYEGQRLFQMPYQDGLAVQRSAAIESLRQFGLDDAAIETILRTRNLEGLDPQARAIALEAIALTDAGRMADKTGYSFGDHISWLRKQYGGDFKVRVEQVEAKMPALGEAYQRAWKVVDDKTGITLATFTDETTAGIAAKVINEGGYVQGAQAPKASVTFLEDTRAVMRALENPDVSSAIHETGHIMLRHLPQQDIDIALKWYREEYKGEVDTIDDGTIIGLHAEDFQEKFSRAFERYLAEGHTPFKALEAVFERMKRWLIDIYHAIVGSEIDVKLTDEMRDLFARQLSGDPELRQQVGEFYGPRPKAAPVIEPAAPMDVSIGGQLHTQPLTLERWLWDRKRSIEAATKIEDPNTRIESIQDALRQSDSVKETGWMPSDAVAQDALARAKAELRSVEGIPGLTGKGTAAHGADPSRYYDFVYRVVELDDLVASHKMNGDPNPDYPTAFQPRQRDRVASRQQVIRIASELEPDALLYQSQRIDDGAPIVGNDLIVESGNGRVLGLRLATDEYPENYRSYKDKLLQDATVYGLDPEALRQMDKPILVRQRVSDVDREAFVREANESATAAMSFTENAASDAKMIGDDVLGALYVGETQSIEQVLRSPSNRNFVQNFINMIPRNEQGIMVDANGEISRIGIQRIIAALFAKTFGGDAGEKLTRLAFESVDVDVKRVISGIQAALPELARAEALIAAGRRPETLSIGDDIAAAATKLQHLRDQGMAVDDYLAQRQMFGMDLTDFQLTLLKEFGAAQSAKAVREPLLYYGRQVEAQPDISQMGMFGGHEYPTKEQLYQLAKTQGQQQLFQMPPEVGGKMGKGIPEPLYMGSLQQEAWDNIQPVMNEMERRMSAGDGWTKTFKREDLDAALGDQRGDFIRWINDLRPDMASTKHQAIRWGENVRDWSLLNYQARRGFDGPMSLLMPYFFWPSRTFLRWALRTIDRPGLMANYVRFNQVASMYQTENFPSRLKGKWRIPLPFLPEWMGGGIYVDPFRQWFPPAMFAENIMRAVTEKDRETKNAAYLLEKWVSEGKASQVEAQQALLTMEGDLWDEAIETVQAEEQGEYSGPLDYLGLLSNLAMPFDILHQYARGTPERIQPLPITRLVKGVTAPFGIGGPGGVNIEAPLRKAVDLPVFDRFEEYRIERMVANMVAEGEIDPKIAEQVFLSHQGPEWDEAEKRVNQARFFGTYANPLFWMGMPADSFPTGEAKLRGLTAEWNRAIDSYHKGDDGALRRMLEEYPEYQFRMDLWKDPNERLRWFLVDEIWTKYNELGSSNKELVRMQLGEDFQQMFLDKPPEGESRNYESIPFELLAFWAQAIGAQLPPLPERNNGYEMPKIEPVAPEQQVSLLPPEIANEIDTFRAERNSQFPNWFAIQQRYFDQPKGDARKVYLVANPELKHYWDWKKQYYAQHPTVDAYYQRYNLSDEEGQEIANWSVPEILSNPVLMRQILAQQTIGEPLSSGALEELRRIWEGMGRPGNSFNQFISEVVSSSNK